MSLRQLRAWHALGLPRFLFRLTGIGALAGLASWLLARVVYRWFDAAAPTLTALWLAIPRGALLGVLLGLVLGWRFRSPRRGRGPGAPSR